MKKSSFAFALAASAAVVALPATATTFPTLTTIYIGTGVRDNSNAPDVGVATVFNCSNVSGVTATVRFLVLSNIGAVLADPSFPILHGTTGTVSTHSTVTFRGDATLSITVAQGVINIESTQSGVFCNALLVDAASVGHGITLPLVRVNPHPGTVE